MSEQPNEGASASERPTQECTPPESKRTIGGYRILRKLGAGGMGVVYEAEQQQPRRLVALKVIRGGAHVDEHAVKLFEREALARLKHPGIAAIYEGGRTAEGEHFFAMELVRGVSATDFLNSGTESAGIEERLRLFATICEAVNHAHQRGVIHRDLKPPNILVSSGATADVPDVKILDFGVARITDADVAATTMLSEAGPDPGHARIHEPRAGARTPMRSICAATSILSESSCSNF